jgi:thiol:disulfide interchange protein DsbD
LSFSLGIITAFAVLGLLAFGLVMGVRQTQWSELFSYWWLAAAVGVIVGVMGLGMFGAFTTGLPQWVYRINPRQDTHTGSFLFGILTAVLSTPCTAPLFPGALGWALTQPPALGLGVFLAAGVGMALPYQILLINPKWLDRLPRSGPGGELIKQIMGLLLIAVAVYFFGVAGRGQNLWGSAYWWAVQDVVIVAMAFMILRVWQITRRWGWRIVLTAVAVLGMFAGWQLGTTFGQAAQTAGQSHWAEYSPDAFAAARDSGRIVVLEFTADWCLNCKALEAAVLRNPRIVERLSANDIAAMKVDLTSRANTAGWNKLTQLGSRGIPLTAVYHPGSDSPILLTSLYTVNALLHAIDTAP